MNEIQLMKEKQNLELVEDASLYCPACGIKSLKTYGFFGIFKCENCGNTIFMVPKIIFDKMMKKIDENHQKELEDLKGAKEK